MGVLLFSATHQQYLAKAQADGEELISRAYVLQKELRSNNRQRITFVVERKHYQATLFRYPIINKGDSVNIHCRLEQPKAFSGFDYPRYLMSQGIEALCTPLSVEVLEREVNLPWLERGRIIIAERIKQLWPRPTSSLVAGLLLGTRESFSQGVLENFSRSGVTHIIALSGFNISILIVFLEQFLKVLSFSRKVRAFFVLGAIILFTIFVGAGASITRAAIMGGLAYALAYFGMAASVWRSMLYTATVMTMLNPFVLMYDIGFQLSFLSTLGLVYLTPIFSKLFFWLPEHFALRESFVTTLAATIATLPLILLKFGTLSVVSPFANVMILPVIPWLMLLGFISLIFSPLFVEITTIGTRYVLILSEIFAQPKWGSMTLEITLVQFLIFVVILIVLIVIHYRYDQKSNS